MKMITQKIKNNMDKRSPMKVQLITDNYDLKILEVDKSSSLNAPQALDMYDINIIDLSYSHIWRCDISGGTDVNKKQDFDSIKKMIQASQKAKIVYVFPQNLYYYNGYTFRQGKEHFYQKLQLKDHIDTVLLHNIAYIFSYPINDLLFYENSVSEIRNSTYDSAFVFNRLPAVGFKSLVVSKGNEKSTVVSHGRITLTTLNILDDNKKLSDFLKECIIKEEREPIPEWLKTHSILDDEEQKRKIDECNEIITEATERIVVANSILKKNMEYKSILYENGDSLVKHVFWILEELLDYDLSDFIDEKKEDFLIQMPDITFIGEIKGVTSNVKSENISQVDVHYQGYMDKLREEGREENVKQLLIMNPLRKYPLENREPVHEIQIKLAERNDCLIITTEVLLQLFEKFRNKEVTTETIKDKFINEIGILDLGVF